MMQSISWIANAIVSLSMLANNLTIRPQLAAAIELRRRLLADPATAQKVYCKAPSPALSLEVKLQKDWTEPCSGPAWQGGLTRQWRIKVHLNFLVIFPAQVPITLTLIIIR